MSDKFVEIYRAANIGEAIAIQSRLQQHQIDVHVENLALQGAIGEIPPGWSSAPQIFVAAADEAAARCVLREIISTPPKSCCADDECLHCGSSMQELDRCSQCGWSYQDAEPTASITLADG